MNCLLDGDILITNRVEILFHSENHGQLLNLMGGCTSN